MNHDKNADTLASGQKSLVRYRYLVAGAINVGYFSGKSHLKIPREHDDYNESRDMTWLSSDLKEKDAAGSGGFHININLGQGWWRILLR
jgi:hypothetical protein